MHPLDVKHQNLVAELEKRFGEAQTILNGDVDADGMEKAKSLLADCEGLKGQIEQVIQLKSTVDGVGKFSSNVTKTLPLGGDTKAILTGTDGKTVVDGSDTWTEGGSAVPVKQWQAIQQGSYKRAMNAYVRAQGKIADLDDFDRKTLTEGTDTAGGFLVPDEFVPQVIAKSPAPSRVNGLVRRIPCSRDRLTMPRVAYTTDDIYATGIRATLTGESPSAGSAHRVTDPVFGSTSISIGTWMLSMPLSMDLLEDAAVPILSWSSGQFNDTIGLLFDNQIINGTGVGAYPYGVLRSPGGTNEPASYTSGTANAIDADQIVGLPFRLPEQYINENTRWVMNRASGGRNVALLKDSENRYLFTRGGMTNGITELAPDTLDGYPITYSAFCPDIGDGLFPIFFGDLKGYYLAIRTAFSLKVLEERYAEENNVLMLGRVRFGGVVAEPFRIVVAKSDNA